VGANTADASVSRCGAQTRLEWDGRKDVRGPDAGRGEVLPWSTAYPRISLKPLHILNEGPAMHALQQRYLCHPRLHTPIQASPGTGLQTASSAGPLVALALSMLRVSSTCSVHCLVRVLFAR
jgi:hypothetical protein